jgi:hypothetical protein
LTFGASTIDAQYNVSYYSKAVNPTPPYRRPSPQLDPITGFHVNNYVGSQRRRQLTTH